MTRLINRISGAIAGALALALIGIVAGALEAGPLDPPGPVASTMRTIDGLTPSWSLRLASDDAPAADDCNSSRFECVLGGDGVLDKETGLVWQRSPTVSTVNTWFGAQFTCAIAVAGSRGGWRLPSIEELSTLVAFPAANPFDDATVSLTGEYWTSTTDPFDQTRALTRSVGSQTVTQRAKDTSGVVHLWCVRGGGTTGS
jgi:hypothetical protein